MILRSFGSAFSFFCPAVKSGRLFWLSSLRGFLQKKIGGRLYGKAGQGGYKPGCCQGTEDCFAGDGTGRCEALEDTRFASGVCPFCKPGDVYEYERVQVKERLIRLDRADLILKYKVD